MRAAIYVRVSTIEQKKHGLSVDSQIDSLTRYCEEHQYAIVGIYNDAGHSAHKKYTSRPALLKLMEDVKRDKIDIVLFTKLDRWFRSVADYYQVQEVLDEYKVPWQAIQEDYETVTSSGRFKVNIMLSVAQSEAERTSERIKSTNQYRRQQGKYVGYAPTGYRIVNSCLVKDEKTQKGMEALFDALLHGDSMSQALRKAKEYGVTRDPGHMWRTIKVPTYHGDAFGHQCEPYITKEEHERILASAKTHPPHLSKTTYMFSKLVRCGICGRSMVGNRDINQLKDGEVVYLYYRCHAYMNTSVEQHYLSITEIALEKYLLEHLDTLYKDAEIKIKARKKQTDRDTLLRQKNSITGKIERLKELFVDGDISKEDYKTKRDALQAQLDSIILDEPSDIVSLPSNWRDIYNALDAEHKQRFWHRIISSITVTKENKRSPDIIFRVDS